MATLALSVAGAAAGGAIGGPIGAAVGRAVGALAGAYIDQALFGATGQERVREGPRLEDLSVVASTEGTDIPRLYGRAKLGGQVIWATNYEEEVSTSSAGGGGKGLIVRAWNSTRGDNPMSGHDVGGWFYIVRPCSEGTGWVALAKREPFVADGNFIEEPGDVWFEFGATEAEARDKIMAEARSLSH